jgi:hypothetical protein
MEEEDMGTFTATWLDANDADEVTKLALAYVDPAIAREWLQEVFTYRFRNEPLIHLKVISTETKETVAVAVWRMPGNLTSGEPVIADKDPVNLLKEVPPPEGTKMELLGTFAGAMMAKKSLLWDQNTSWGELFAGLSSYLK